MASAGGTARPAARPRGADARPSARALRVELVDAHRAQAVRELGLGPLRDVLLDLLPVAAVVADPLARRADRQHAAQYLDVLQRLAKLPVDALELGGALVDELLEVIAMALELFLAAGAL